MSKVCVIVNCDKKAKYSPYKFLQFCAEHWTLIKNGEVALTTTFSNADLL